ncbi:MAG: hypothetical protein ACXV5H_07195 [Halobacteriota archaeon]
MSLLAISGLIDPIRIYERHHWPTGVAGYLLGTTYVIELVALYRRVSAREGGPEW